MFRKAGLLLILGTVVAVVVSLSVTPASYSVVPVAAPAVPDQSLSERLGYKLPHAKFQGTGSCATMGCHNADGAKGQAGAEVGTWVRHDPHAIAYSVLFTDRSKRMVKLFRQLGEGETPRPQHDQLCLKCHSISPGESKQGIAPNRAHLADAVGCEACHGPAEHYLTTHYQSWWQSLSRQRKANEYGLYPTDDLAFRTMVCAQCHVGDSDREVDHRLIAAGHPALRFEYTSHHFHPKYTRHWREDEYGPDFEVRAWVIGQVAALRASVALLKDRAEGDPNDWPELAEYNCFSCHHQLQSPSWRQKVNRGPAGLPAWNTWHEPMARRAAEQLRTLEPELSVPAWRSLEKLREAMNFARADAEQVAALAKVALAELDALLAELQRRADRNSRTSPYTAGQVGSVIDELLRSARGSEKGKPTGLDWDRAAQHYLGIAALYHGWSRLEPGRRDPAARDAIRGAGAPLAFPEGFDSPAKRFTPEAFREGIDRIDELRKQ